MCALAFAFLLLPRLSVKPLLEIPRHRLISRGRIFHRGDLLVPLGLLSSRRHPPTPSGSGPPGRSFPRILTGEEMS